MFIQKEIRLQVIFLFMGFLFMLFASNDLFADEQEFERKPNFIEDFYTTFRLQIKSSPAEGKGIPHDSLPNWLESWKKFKKELEERYGTSINILLDDHHQHILNGPGSCKGGVFSPHMCN